MNELRPGDVVGLSPSARGRVTRVEDNRVWGVYLYGEPDIGGGSQVTGWSRAASSLQKVDE